MFKFIHTSDWQVGKAFGGFPEEVRGALRQARTEMVRSIGRVSMERGISHVLVAGDVYDIEEPSELTLGRPIEAMRSFPAIAWHLMPGNHDSARSEGIWARLVDRGLPHNVLLHLEARPVALGTEAFLLPSPLPRRRSLGDLTQWTEEAATPEGALRIGMAHGPVVGFKGEGEMEENLVPPGRPVASGLDYLAMGDWHGVKRIGPRLWYSGTPESDRFKPIEDGTISGGGSVLEVVIEGHGATPQVTPIQVGKYSWHTLSWRLLEAGDLLGLQDAVAIMGEPGRVLLKLSVEGALPLSGLATFEEAVRRRMAASFAHLELDAERLVPDPTEQDLETIDKGGFVRAASERLKNLCAGIDAERARVARLALTRLYVEARAIQVGAIREAAE